jgi:hypothetical protein
MVSGPCWCPPSMWAPSTLGRGEGKENASTLKRFQGSWTKRNQPQQSHAAGEGLVLSRQAEQPRICSKKGAEWRRGLILAKGGVTELHWGRAWWRALWKCGQVDGKEQGFPHRQRQPSLGAAASQLWTLTHKLRLSGPSPHQWNVHGNNAYLPGLLWELKSSMKNASPWVHSSELKGEIPHFPTRGRSTPLSHSRPLGDVSNWACRRWRPQRPLVLQEQAQALEPLQKCTSDISIVLKTRGLCFPKRIVTMTEPPCQRTYEHTCNVRIYGFEYCQPSISQVPQPWSKQTAFEIVVRPTWAHLYWTCAEFFLVSTP